MTTPLLTEVDARGVATLTLNRPEKHNALSGALIEALTDAAHSLGDDPAVRVVVLKGAGPTFCAGGDLAWMKDQTTASPDARKTAAKTLAGMLGALNTMPKPLIGQVHGGAFGGGVGLCSICDIVFAHPDTKFGLTETKLGLIPATIGPYVAAKMGDGQARQVFMSSRRFDAVRAQALGIVSVITDDLRAEVDAEIQAYLLCAPGAVAAAKTALLRSAPDQAAIEASIDALEARWSDPETAAGLAAFFERKPPPWASS